MLQKGSQSGRRYQMKYLPLKVTIIIGIIIIILATILIRVNAQENQEQLKILTEISVDIKYIKKNISDIKEDNRELKEDAVVLGSRVTRVEERQINIKENIYGITERSNWVTGIIGSILVIMLGLQLKRSYSHRKDNGKTAH